MTKEIDGFFWLAREGSRSFEWHGGAGNSWSTAPRLRNGIALQGNAPFIRLQNGILLQEDGAAEVCALQGRQEFRAACLQAGDGVKLRSIIPAWQCIWQYIKKTFGYLPGFIEPAATMSIDIPLPDPGRQSVHSNFDISIDRNFLVMAEIELPVFS